MSSKLYLQNSSGSPLWKQRLQCFTSFPFMLMAMRRDHQDNRSNIAWKKKARHICGNFITGLFCGGDRGKLHFLKFPRSVGPFDPRKLLSYWSIFSKASLIIQSSFNHNSIFCIFIDIISTVREGLRCEALPKSWHCQDWLNPHPPFLAHWWISRQKVRKCDSRQSIKSA